MVGCIFTFSYRRSYSHLPLNLRGVNQSQKKAKMVNFKTSNDHKNARGTWRDRSGSQMIELELRPIRRCTLKTAGLEREREL